MKTVITGILLVLSYLGIIGSIGWAIVGFILYLVKDYPFNWWSVILIPVSYLLMFVFAVLFSEFKDTPRRRR